MRPLIMLFLQFLASTSAGPVMERFSLDFERGILALTFNETMSNATGDVDWTGVSLRSHVNGLEGSGVTLWNTQGEYGWGDTLSTDEGLTLVVDVHPIDLDEMKAGYVGHNSSFTWLTLRAGAFASLDGGNGNEPIYGTHVVGHRGVSVSQLVEDTTSPTLDRFTLSTTNRELVLFFSEGVAALTALEPSALSLSLYFENISYSGDHLVGASLRGSVNASLSCSAAGLGRTKGSSRSASRREVVLRLDEPCATATASIADSSLPLMEANSSSSSLAEANGTSSSTAAEGELNEAAEAASGGVMLVGSNSSDWSTLAAAGVLIEDAYGGVSVAEGASLSLNAMPEFVTDLSAAANPLVPVGNLSRSFPDCQPCGNGTFRSEPCTDVYDAECTPCSEACEGEDRFALSPCTAEADLDCHRCTPCAFGTREVGECQQSSDRVCEACTECGEGEYESQECRASGEDRICETCLRCVMSPEVADACRDSRPVWQWQMDNCCETVDGEKVPCADVALENLRISARRGRRHWVSTPSVPPVDGYSQLYWGRGETARDGVTPRDRLIEVEFRPEAETVFDDPRYRGQEGPTGGGGGVS